MIVRDVNGRVPGPCMIFLEVLGRVSGSYKLAGVGPGALVWTGVQERPPLFGTAQMPLPGGPLPLKGVGPPRPIAPPPLFGALLFHVWRSGCWPASTRSGTSQ